MDAPKITTDSDVSAFAWYLQAVERKVRESWKPLTAGSERPVIVFEIGRNGRVQRVSVQRPSGNEAFDRGAQSAIHASDPFPPLPPEFKEPVLRVHLEFERLDRKQGAGTAKAGGSSSEKPPSGGVSPVQGETTTRPAAWLLGTWDGVHRGPGVGNDATRFEFSLGADSQILWRMARIGVIDGQSVTLVASGTVRVIGDTALELTGTYQQSNFPTVVGRSVTYSLSRRPEGLEGKAHGPSAQHDGYPVSLRRSAESSQRP